MQVTVRLNSALGRVVGAPRLTLSLRDGSTVADLHDHLIDQYPDSASLLAIAVTVIGGRQAAQSDPLVAGQEVAFLLPVAGGAVPRVGITSKGALQWP